MLSALWIGLSLITSAICAALSWRHPFRVSRLLSSDADALARSLRRLPQSSRLAELVQRSSPDSWEQALGRALGRNETSEKIAAVNELLMDVDAWMTEGAGWPVAGLRLSAIGALLLAVLSFLSGGGVVVVAVVLGIGGVGALLCAVAWQSGRMQVKRQRSTIDALVAAVATDLTHSRDHSRVRGGR